MGFLGKRTSERDALLLAARQLVRLALGERGQLDHGQHLGDAGGDLVLGHAFLPEAEADIRLDRHVREERIGLEHHVARAPVGRHAGQALPVQQHVALGRVLEAGHHAHHGGLAAARRPQQGEELALVDRQGNIVDRGEVAEALGDAAELDERLGAGSFQGANFRRTGPTAVLAMMNPPMDDGSARPALPCLVQLPAMQLTGRSSPWSTGA